MQSLGISGIRITQSAYINLQNILAPIYILSCAQFDPHPTDMKDKGKESSLMKKEDLKE